MKSFYLAALLAVSSHPSLAQKVDPSEDTPEEIAKDAARDLKDSRFYNRPGATRADYDRDWQECRLIARGARTPSGTTSFYNSAFYNPAISPLAAGIGGSIGAAIGAAIVERQMRRENRRNCLLIRGWRLVEPTKAKAAEIAAMSNARREEYLNAIIGAQEVEGELTVRDTFAPPSGSPASMGGKPVGQPTLFMGKKVTELDLAPGEGAVMMVFRRNDKGSAGRSGSVELRRYDFENRDFAYQPKDWKKMGDRTTYSALITSDNRKAAYEMHVVKLTAGEYVINGDSLGRVAPAFTNCFGAPLLKVEQGRIAYISDLIPFLNAQQADGSKLSGIAYARDFIEARGALSAVRPDLAELLIDGQIRNGATYTCAGSTMTRMDYPGAERLTDDDVSGETVATRDAGMDRF